MEEKEVVLDPKQLKELQEALKDGDSREKKLSLMVVGKTGEGKSCLINGLLGLKDPADPKDGWTGENTGAPEGHEGLAETTKLTKYSKEKQGVVVEVWDTPGLEGDETDNVLQEISIQTGNKLDLMVFCIKVQAGSRVSSDHERVIIKLTKSFSENIWKHAIFVMTMVNLSSDHKDKYTTKLANIKQDLIATLQRARVSATIARNVPLVAAGKSEGILPHEDKEWTENLLEICHKKVDCLKRKAPTSRNHLPTLNYKMVGIGTGVGALSGVCIGAVVGGPFALAAGLGIGGLVGGGIVTTASMAAAKKQDNKTV